MSAFDCDCVCVFVCVRACCVCVYFVCVVLVVVFLFVCVLRACEFLFVGVSCVVCVWRVRASVLGLCVRCVCVCVPNVYVCMRA